MFGRKKSNIKAKRTKRVSLGSKKTTQQAKQSSSVATKNKRSQIPRSQSSKYEKLSSDVHKGENDVEKFSRVHDLVTQTENNFICLTCTAYFSDYLALAAHKIICNPNHNRTFLMQSSIKLQKEIKNEGYQPKYNELDGIISKKGKN